MKCRSCGTPSPEGAWVCPGCGAALVTHESEPRAVVGEEPVADGAEAEESVWEAEGSEFVADDPPSASSLETRLGVAAMPAATRPKSTGCLVAIVVIGLIMCMTGVGFAVIASLAVPEPETTDPVQSPIEMPSELPSDLPSAPPYGVDDQSPLVGPQPTQAVRDGALETLAVYYHALQAADFLTVRKQMTGQAAADFDADPYETTAFEIVSWEVTSMNMDGAALMVGVRETLRDADGVESPAQAVYVLEPRSGTWLISEAEYGD